MANMTVRETYLRDISAKDRERWRALSAHAVEPNPFFEPDFVLAAAQHLGGQTTTLLVVEDGERWLACLPVQRARIGRAVLVFRTWRHVHCFLGTPLLDADAAPAAARALLDGASRRAPGSRVSIELLAEGGRQQRRCTRPPRI